MKLTADLLRARLGSEFVEHSLRAIDAGSLDALHAKLGVQIGSFSIEHVLDALASYVTRLVTNVRDHLVKASEAACRLVVSARASFFAALSPFYNILAQLKTASGAALSSIVCQFREMLSAVFEFLKPLLDERETSVDEKLEQTLPACFTYSGALGALVARWMRKGIKKFSFVVDTLMRLVDRAIHMVSNGVEFLWTLIDETPSRVLATPLGVSAQTALYRLAFFAAAVPQHMLAQSQRLTDAAGEWAEAAASRLLECFKPLLAVFGRFVSAASSAVASLGEMLAPFIASVSCILDEGAAGLSAVSSFASAILHFASMLLAGPSVFVQRILMSLVVALGARLARVVDETFRKSIVDGAFSIDDKFARYYKQVGRNLVEADSDGNGAIKNVLERINALDSRVATALRALHSTGARRSLGAAWAHSGVLARLHVVGASSTPSREDRDVIQRAIGIDFFDLVQQHENLHAELGSSVRAAVHEFADERESERREELDAEELERDDEFSARMLEIQRRTAATPTARIGIEPLQHALALQNIEDEVVARDQVSSSAALNVGTDTKINMARSETLLAANERMNETRGWRIACALLTFGIPIALYAYGMYATEQAALLNERAAITTVMTAPSYSLLQTVLSDISAASPESDFLVGQMDIRDLQESHWRFSRYFTDIADAGVAAPNESSFRSRLSKLLNLPLSTLDLSETKSTYIGGTTVGAADEWRALTALWNGDLPRSVFAQWRGGALAASDVVAKLKKGFGGGTGDEPATTADASVREYIAPRVASILRERVNSEHTAMLENPLVRPLVTSSEARAKDSWFGWVSGTIEDAILPEGRTTLDKFATAFSRGNFAGMVLLGAKVFMPTLMVGAAFLILSLAAYTIPRYYFVDSVIEIERNEAGFARRRLLWAWLPTLCSLATIPSFYIYALSQAVALQGSAAAALTGAVAGAATNVAGAALGALGSSTSSVAAQALGAAAGAASGGTTGLIGAAASMLTQGISAEVSASSISCEQCGGSASALCGVCGSAAYCGPSCQAAHWSAHKRACSIRRFL